jgi:hypothetical protein
VPAPHCTPGQGDLFTTADLPTTAPASPPTGDRPTLPRPTQHGEQTVLFDPPVEPEPASVPYARTDPGALSAVLAGDGYGWLAQVLPDPAPVWCTPHRTPMRRTGPARLLYACDRCDAERPDAAEVAA